MDPDHPLAALVYKARQERNGSAAMATQPEVADPAVSGTSTQYAADRKYRALCSSEKQTAPQVFYSMFAFSFHSAFLALVVQHLSTEKILFVEKSNGSLSSCAPD